MADKEDEERATHCPISVFHPLGAEGWAWGLRGGRVCQRERAVLGVLSRCGPG